MLPVTVIIPCYRAGGTLGRALASVAAQTKPPAEVVVVDDASDDDTPERLAALASQVWPFALRSFRLLENKGAGEARNAGWDAAAGTSEWIAFLDADDEWAPEKLERQVGWMNAHPDFAWSAHRCTWGDRGDYHLSLQPKPEAGEAGRGPAGPRPRWEGEEELTRNGLLWRNRIATPTVLVRRAVAVRFRPCWRRCEDLLLWQDLLAAGWRGALLRDPLARLGRRPTTGAGLTGDLAAMHAAELQVIGVLYGEGRLSVAATIVWKIWARLKYLRRRLRR